MQNDVEKNTKDEILWRSFNCTYLSVNVIQVIRLLIRFAKFLGAEY
jgi:hypothetical protein